MHYAVLFLYMFLPVEILLIGIIVLLMIGIFDKKITRKFNYLNSRMRILYGYIVVICSIISLIVFWYIYSPFETIWPSYFSTQITPFSAGVIIAIGIATVIGSFLSMVEVALDTNRSFILFISLLLLESSPWFILASDSWINVFFGFLLVFTSINLLLRRIHKRQNQENDNILTNYLVMSSLAISILFVGIGCLTFSGNQFLISIQNTTHIFWEYIGIILVIVSLLILIGVPPFHNWFFKVENNKLTSSSFILLIVQRSLALLFLVKYSVSISGSQLNTFLLWFFASLGLLCSIWGVLGSITVRHLHKLLHYISLLYIGIIFMLLSDIYTSPTEQNYVTDSILAIMFSIFVYMAVCSFSLSLFSSITKGYKSSEISILGSISRNSITQYLVNLFNIILLFISPISFFIVSKKYDFSTEFTPQKYFVSISIIIVLIFTLINFIKLIKALAFSTKGQKVHFNRIEPATVISTILLVIVNISLLILVIQFLGFCDTIASLLIS